jgi:TPR repeat protein
MRRAFVLALLFACGGRTAQSGGATTTSTANGSAKNEPPATAEATPRICTREGKNPFPCVEECDRGIATACATLAVRTEHGEGVPKDTTRAVMLYERACELKDPSACSTAARMHAVGAGVPPNRQKQIDLLAQACLLGDVIACALPAKALSAGIGVGKDEHRARELWQRGCSGGVESSCDALSDAGSP